MKRYISPAICVVLLVICGWQARHWLAAKPIAESSKADASLAATLTSSLVARNGLCVHLNPRDGSLTTHLSDDGRILVHGLCANSETVEKVRSRISAAGLEGIVSVETGTFDKLPYADRISNLTVADDLSVLLDQGINVKELVRITRPGGTLWLGERTAPNGKTALGEKQLGDLLTKAGIKEFEVSKQNGIWARVEVPRPADMDAWTHKRRDPTGNPVSTDNYIGLPSGVRWIAGPNWPTGGRKSVIYSVVASKDRLVYSFEDEAKTPEGPKPQQSLIARDGFNGLLLWKRKTDDARALVSVDDRVYTILEEDGPLVALDAASGKVVHEYNNVTRPGEVTYVDGSLLVDHSKGLSRVDAKSGEQIWHYPDRPEQVKVGDGVVYLHTEARARTGERVSHFMALDFKTGKLKWQAPTKSWTKSEPKLLLYRKGLLVASTRDGNDGISAEDGSHRWHYEYQRIGHGGSYEKVLYMHDLVWVHTASTGNTGQYAWEGLDPMTGEIKKKVIQPREFRYKHRCNYDVATQRYFVCGSMDFADVETGEYSHFTAARNSCNTGGSVPANGLLYTFPHACGCFPMLRGFLGLADTNDPEVVTPKTASSRLEKGPSFGKMVASGNTSKSDWPTYRHDNVRSGSATVAGPSTLEKLWSAKVASDPTTATDEWDLKDGGRMTSPVIASGLAYAAATDHHRLSAFDAKTGEPRWQFTAGGRVDCPPTIDSGLCLLGSRDGWVYCLRADDGTLMWRFRAAPEDRRVVAYGQLESPWPIVGGVLAYDGLAYCVAGRHEGADGGVFVHALEPKTGKLVWANRPRDYTGVPDVLNGADGNIQMASYTFDAKTGTNASSAETRLRGGRLGLLNDAWYKRPIAMRKNLQQWASGSKTGQMFTFSPTATCAYRACEGVSGGDGRMSGDATLFALPKDGKRWKIDMPNTSRMKGMVVADDTLYVAGKLQSGGKLTNVVRAYSMDGGKMLDEFTLGDELVHDCLAVAGGRVYVTTQGGELICLGER